MASERRPADVRAVVLDDDATIRRMLEKVLQKRGYEVRCYESPGQCPLYAPDGACPGGGECGQEKACADLLLTDIQMPGASGLDLIETLGKRSCAITYVAVMSGTWSPSQLKVLETRGFKALYKPFRLAELNEWLDECEAKLDPDRQLAEWPA
jgi:CheY-like chemotaxis protein